MPGWISVLKRRRGKALRWGRLGLAAVVAEAQCAIVWRMLLSVHARSLEELSVLLVGGVLARPTVHTSLKGRRLVLRRRRRMPLRVRLCFGVSDDRLTTKAVKGLSKTERASHLSVELGGVRRWRRWLAGSPA